MDVSACDGPTPTAGKHGFTGGITRLAVNPTGDHLALVAEEPAADTT